MSRCKSCNRILDDRTLKSKKPDGSDEDMCGHCRSKASFQYNILTDREYGQAAITGDALSPSDTYFYDWVD